MTEREPRVQRAVATRRWTGSWYTMFITVDRRGSDAVDAEFEDELRALHRALPPRRPRRRDRCAELRRARHRAARLHQAGLLRGRRRAAPARRLQRRSAGRAATTGFFHPDRFTFGQPVYLSAVIAAAMAVPGVAYVTPVRFQRLGRNPAGRDRERPHRDGAARDRAARQRPECAGERTHPLRRGHRSLTMNDDTASLNGCGCCEGLAEPAPVQQRPRAAGAALSRRHAARLLCAHAAEPAARAQPIRTSPTAPRPLARLLTRASDDPTVALVDAAACVADVLDLLPGAHRQRRLPAHRDRAALGARAGARDRLRAEARCRGQRATCASRSRTRPARPASARSPQGTPVQSVPPQGKLPQVFETSAELVAHAEWNALRAAPSAARRHGGASTCRRQRRRRRRARRWCCSGRAAAFPAGTAGSAHRAAERRACSASTRASRSMRPSMRSKSAASTSPTRRPASPAATCCCSSRKRGSDLVKLVLRAIAVVAEPALKRVRVDVEALPDPVGSRRRRRSRPGSCRTRSSRS